MNPETTPTTPQQKDKMTGTRVLHALAAVFKNVKLYKPDHPSTKETARKFANLLNNEVFKEKLDITIHNTDGIFIINDMFFIEESLAHYDLLRSLEEHKIDQLIFAPGISEEETTSACAYLMKRKMPGTTEPPLQSAHVKCLTSDDTAAMAARQGKQKFKGNSRYPFIKNLYEEGIKITDQTLTRLLEEQTLSISDLTPMLENIQDGLHQSASSFSILLSTTPITNLHVQHSFHTAVLTLFLGQQLSIDPSTQRVLGVAALLHDIGRFLLPADFTTGYRLQPGDNDFIQLHTRDGASYLAGVPGLPMNVVRAALEHHVGFDNIGYPILPGFQKPHFFSRIIGIADFMSWATVSDNYYHKPVALYRLVRSLMARAGTQFDPFFVKLLLPFYGLYPAGTRVRLTNGETGVVLEPNVRNITRPSVASVDSKGNRVVRWLGSLSSASEGNPYMLSVKSTMGREADYESFIELLPQVEELKH